MKFTVLSVGALLVAITASPIVSAGTLSDTWQVSLQGLDGLDSAVQIDDGIYWDIRADGTPQPVVIADPCHLTNPFSGGLLGAVGDAAVGTYNPTCSVVFQVAGIIVTLVGVVLEAALGAIFLITDIVVTLAGEVVDAGVDLVLALVDLIIGMVDPVVQFVDAVIVATCTALTGSPDCGLGNPATILAQVCTLVTGNPNCDYNPQPYSLRVICYKLTGSYSCHLDEFVIQQPVIYLPQLQLDADGSCLTC